MDIVKKVIIFGISDFAYQVFRYIERDKQFDVCAFTVDRNYYSCSEFRGLPVVPFDELHNKYPCDQYSMLICIGYKQMNGIRLDTFHRVKERGYPIVEYRHESAVILSDDIGEGNFFFEGVVIGPGCKIGRSNIIFAQSNVAHDCVIGSFNFISSLVAIAGHVTIKDSCFFGTNSAIRDSVTISSHTLVGAAAYIRKNTNEFDVYAAPQSILLKKKSYDIQL